MTRVAELEKASYIAVQLHEFSRCDPVYFHINCNLRHHIKRRDNVTCHKVVDVSHISVFIFLIYRLHHDRALAFGNPQTIRRLCTVESAC